MHLKQFSLQDCNRSSMRGCLIISFVSWSRFVLTFSLGAGPVPGLLLSEILPSRIRAKAMAVCMSIHWVIELSILMFITYFFFHITMHVISNSRPHIFIGGAFHYPCSSKSDFAIPLRKFNPKTSQASKDIQCQLMLAKTALMCIVHSVPVSMPHLECTDLVSACCTMATVCLQTY